MPGWLQCTRAAGGGGGGWLGLRTRGARDRLAVGDARLRLGKPAGLGAPLRVEAFGGLGPLPARGKAGRPPFGGASPRGGTREGLAGSASRAQEGVPARCRCAGKLCWREVSAWAGYGS